MLYSEHDINVYLFAQNAKLRTIFKIYYNFGETSIFIQVSMDTIKLL
jgi:hypothetical protein